MASTLTTSWGIYSKPSGGIGGMACQPLAPYASDENIGSFDGHQEGPTMPVLEESAGGISAPLYAPASFANGSSNGGDMMDLNDIFTDDFLVEQGSLDGSFDSEQGGIMLGDQELDVLPGPKTSRGAKPRSRNAPPPPKNKPPVDDHDDEYDDDDEEEYSNGGTGQTRRRKKAKLTLKPLTEAQRVERRERNREHAKRSRMRKKFMLESLQAQMTALRKENLKLRQAVTIKMPEKADTILKTCNASARTTSVLSTVELGHHRALQDSDGKLIKCLQYSQQNFTVSDPSLPDNPIVYASEGFVKLTGYTREQVLGRNCRFLQGPGTDPDAVDIIRRAIAAGEDASVCLLNYKADGTPFWNQFFVAALRDERGNIVNYVGVQCEVAEASMEDELKERVKSLNWAEEK